MRRKFTSELTLENCWQWQQERAEGFHTSHFPRGHMPTDFERWFGADGSVPYAVQYRDMFEPYIIASKGKHSKVFLSLSLSLSLSLFAHAKVRILNAQKTFFNYY